MNTHAQASKDEIETFFLENGKLICVELLKIEQLKVNKCIADKMRYRDYLTTENDQSFDSKRYKHLAMLNDEIEIWLNYCQTVEHTIRILEVDVLRLLKFDIDHWVEFQHLQYEVAYQKSLVRALSKSTQLQTNNEA